MTAVALYVLKVCLCTVAFYFPYRIIFSRTTFFTTNRFYLLAGLVLSFILPVITIETPETVYLPTLEIWGEPFHGPQTTLNISSGSPASHQFDYALLLFVFYCMGVVIHLIRLWYSLLRISKLKHGGEIFIVDQTKVIRTDTEEAFAFFNLIFLPKRKIHSLILHHEKIHIQQFHWIDLVLVEIASILLWFNPLMVFYSRAVKLQHEFLADESCARKGNSLEEYLNSMLEHLGPIETNPLISPFQFQFIKKRINMLTSKKSSQPVSAIYLILIPVMACLLFSFSTKRVYSPIIFKANDSTKQSNLEFIAPLENKNLKISSEFGERIHPVLGKKMQHTGVDFFAKEGDKIVSAESGVVIQASFDDNRGNFIVIKHDEVFTTSYSHLKAMKVQEGDQVKKGQDIGSVGNTGLSTKYHLHYEVIKDGEPVNPNNYLSVKK